MGLLLTWLSSVWKGVSERECQPAVLRAAGSFATAEPSAALQASNQRAVPTGPGSSAHLQGLQVGEGLKPDQPEQGRKPTASRIGSIPWGVTSPPGGHPFHLWKKAGWADGDTARSTPTEPERVLQGPAAPLWTPLPLQLSCQSIQQPDPALLLPRLPLAAAPIMLEPHSPRGKRKERRGYRLDRMPKSNPSWRMPPIQGGAAPRWGKGSRGCSSPMVVWGGSSLSSAAPLQMRAGKRAALPEQPPTLQGRLWNPAGGGLCQLEVMPSPLGLELKHEGSWGDQVPGERPSLALAARCTQGRKRQRAPPGQADQDFALQVLREAGAAQLPPDLLADSGRALWANCPGTWLAQGSGPALQNRLPPKPPRACKSCGEGGGASSPKLGSFPVFPKSGWVLTRGAGSRCVRWGRCWQESESLSLPGCTKQQLPRSPEMFKLLAMS